MLDFLAEYDSHTWVWCHHALWWHCGMTVSETSLYKPYLIICSLRTASVQHILIRFLPKIRLHSRIPADLIMFHKVGRPNAENILQVVDKIKCVHNCFSFKIKKTSNLCNLLDIFLCKAWWKHVSKGPMYPLSFYASFNPGSSLALRFDPEYQIALAPGPQSAPEALCQLIVPHYYKRTHWFRCLPWDSNQVAEFASRHFEFPVVL